MADDDAPAGRRRTAHRAVPADRAAVIHRKRAVGEDAGIGADDRAAVVDRRAGQAGETDPAVDRAAVRDLADAAGIEGLRLDVDAATVAADRPGVVDRAAVAEDDAI